MTSKNWVEPARVREVELGATHALARARAKRVRARRLLAIVDRIEAAQGGDDPHARAVVARLRLIASGSMGVASPVCIDGAGERVGKP